MKKKNLAFTLAEVLIVIGIIGVVAALTLPNLNHATGDKETVTRLQKAYSILNEANDRAVAIYGPVSSWKSNEQCAQGLDYCWMKRIGEFLKISKSCDEEVDSDSDNYSSCDYFKDNSSYFDFSHIVYQLPDGTTFSLNGWGSDDCNISFGDGDISDFCCTDLYVDINGPDKGKNKSGEDIFRFGISDSIGITAFEYPTSYCMQFKDDEDCTYWVLEYGNLDYLKADESGKCNDSNIILDGTTNTSCH